jgi:gamma-glutamyltranspeptidase/glutathione hydrolase
MEGAVTTPHAFATEAGVQAYAAGGNAIDAALAAAATLTVVYPHQCAIGGDLFALVDDGAGKVWSVNGSGAAAANMTADALRTRYREMPDGGPDSITVPGIIAGWHTIQGLGAALPVEHFLAPAIRAAADGIPVSPSLARGIRSRRATLLRDAGIRALFLPGGEPLGGGAIVRQSQLARTLEALARDGLADFYTGAIGDRLVAGLARMGSPLSRADFAAHRTELAVPLQLDHRGFQIHTCPANSQGFMLLEAIAALDGLAIDIEPLGRNARYLLWALLLAAEDRDRYLGDPRCTTVPWHELLAPERLKQRLSARAAGQQGHAGPASPIPAHGDTVAVCAMDSNGMAVSLIQSLYQTFGSGLCDPDTGVIFHNRARGFSLTPGAPNELMPGTRPAHTLAPALVRRNSRTVSALGTMGGRAQPQILAQIVPGVLDMSASLADVLGAPRWVVGTRDLDFARPTVAIEADAPGSLDAILQVDDLDVARIPARDERLGHAQAVRLGPDGSLQAAADPRSDGSGRVYSRARDSGAAT